MAMYSQLSEELEETNQGVVALYAELVDRTTLAGSAVDGRLAGLRTRRADP